MPAGFFAGGLTAQLEPVTTKLLLPLFFVYSGLNPQIGLVNTPRLWAITLGLLVVAVLVMVDSSRMNRMNCHRLCFRVQPSSWW